VPRKVWDVVGRKNHNVGRPRNEVARDDRDSNALRRANAYGVTFRTCRPDENGVRSKTRRGAATTIVSWMPSERSTRSSAMPSAAKLSRVCDWGSRAPTLRLGSAPLPAPYERARKGGFSEVGGPPSTIRGLITCFSQSGRVRRGYGHLESALPRGQYDRPG
jgi:hypothetical protein